MKVIATRASSREGPDYVSYVGLSDELPTLIARADVVVSALPLVPSTTHLFDAKMFARMKKTAFFINVGRGGSVVTDDLTQRSTAGRSRAPGWTSPSRSRCQPSSAVEGKEHNHHAAHGRRVGARQSDRAMILREQVRRYAAGDKLLSVVDMKKGY